jgi:hypothetical protein
LLKGGARWEDAQFVASDQSEQADKKAAFREVLYKTTKNSYTQTIYTGVSTGQLKRVLTITARRELKAPTPSASSFKLKPNAPQTAGINMPGPAVQDYMLGTWSIALSYEPSPEFPKGALGQGGEVWWAGPGGYSMIEEYYQNDANEHVEEFSPAWWDAQAGGQRFLYCANTLPEGCYIPDGVFRWEGNNLVLSDDREQQGKIVTHLVSFRDITKNSFTEINEEADSGEPPKVTLTIHAVRVLQ